MGKSGGDLSVADLERMLTNRKSLLGSLEKKRTRLQRELAGIERQISVLEGRRRAGGLIRSVRRRAKNEKSLHDVLRDVLAKNKKGYSLEELVNKVLATGYKTHSGNFKNVVYQCIYNSKYIAHDEKSGTYQLVKTSA